MATFNGNPGVNDLFVGGAAADVFNFAPADLTGDDTVTGGAGAAVDALRLTAAGAVSSAAFANTSGIEQIALFASGASSVGLTDALVGSANGALLSVLGGAGSDTVDGGAVATSTNRISVTAGGGTDTFFGGAGSDIFRIAVSDLTGADRFDGGGGADQLQFSTAGSITTAMLAGVRQVESIQLADGSNTIFLANALVSTAANATLTVRGGSGADLINGVRVSNAAYRLDVSTGTGADTIFGGGGADLFRFAAAELTAADSVAGGGGADRIVLTTAGTADFSRVSAVETIQLANGANGVALTDAIVGSATGSRVTVIGGTGADTIDGSGVIDAANKLSVTLGAGADSVTGGAGADVFSVATVDLTSADRVEGGGGLDELALSSSGLVSLVGVTGVETIRLFNGGANELTVSDAVASSAGGLLTVIGGAGADTVDGSGLTGVNRLDVTAGAGADRILGGAGDDVARFASASLTADDTVTGGAGADQIVLSAAGSANAGGVAGVETIRLFGSGLNGLTIGNATVSSLGGAALKIVGGGGNDTINGAAVTDAVNALDVTAGAGSDSIVGGAGDDVIRFEAAAITNGDRVSGGAGSDTLALSTAGTVAALAFRSVTGIETLELADGANNVSVADAMVSSLAGRTLVVRGGTGADTISGAAVTTAANKLALFGDAGADSLTGGAGADTLDGGAGVDTMAGGLGNDVYTVDDGADAINEAANGGTADRVESTVSYTLGANVEQLVLLGSADLGGTGNAGANRIEGNAGANTLQGGDLADTLIGGGGADYLDGGTGADSMAGGTGADNYVVDAAGDVVDETGGDGVDTVVSSITYTLGAEIENLTLTGALDRDGTGNGGDNGLTGNAGANVLLGLGGQDYLNGAEGADTLDGGADADALDGGTGADQMTGGSGNDTYTVDDLGDTIVELAGAGEGADTVVSSVDFTLGSNVENLTLTGSLNLVGNGNELDNSIIGNAGNNALSGADGADYVDGADGNDSLVGGTGGDNVNGGAGADTLDGGADGDTLAGGADDDTYLINDADVVQEAAGGGTDTVIASIDYTLGAEVENLALTGAARAGTGNALNNRITGSTGDDTLAGLGGVDTLLGGDGNDSLDGGIGADSMEGGANDDVYVVSETGDLVVEALNAGTDAVQTALNNHVLGANVENLTITGSIGRVGSGNELANVLRGGLGADTLNGLGGNDTLFGSVNGGPADSLKGGAGDDTYNIRFVDAVDETGGSGVDTVRIDANETGVAANATYTLGAAFENLEFLGSFAGRTGTGNASNNVLTAGSGGMTLNGLGGLDTLNGGAGNDTLDGGAGADRMIGGLGDDVYRADATADVADETGGGGTDRVESSATYTLGAGVENLTLTGAGNVAGTGNELANVIAGNGANNSLSGLAGADTLNGGAGADTLNGGADADVLIGGAGQDSVVGGLGADTLVIRASDFVGGETYDGTAEAGTIDTLRLDAAGDYFFESGTFSNIDRITINANQAGFAFQGLDDLLATADYDMNGTVGGGYLRLDSAVALTNGIYFEGAFTVGSIEIAGDNFGGADTLFGSDGADIVNSGAGVDQVDLRVGSDTYIVSQVANLTGADTITGGFGGYDVLRLDAAGTYNPVNANGFEEVSLNATGAYNLTLGTNLATSGVADFRGYAVFLKVASTGVQSAGQAVSAAGVSGGNIFVDGFNFNGADTITGSAGYDVVEAGAGADAVNLGAGEDLMLVRNASDFVGDTLNGGTVETTWDWLELGDAGVYNLGTSVTNFDILTLNENAAGFQISVTNSQTTTADVNRDGTLRDFEIQTLVTMTNGVSVNASAVTTGGIQFLGSVNGTAWQGPGTGEFNGDDTVIGGAGADTIISSGGADLISAGAGADSIEAGSGDDTVTGGAGADTIFAGEGADVIVFAAAADLTTAETIDGGIADGAIDRLRLDGAGTYAINADRIDFIDAVSLNSNAGATTVTLTGGLGFFADGDGDASGPGGEYGDFLVNALIALTQNVTVNASGLDSGYLVADGANWGGADTIIGSAGADVIRGGLGNDSLTGGLGGDTFTYASGAEFGASEAINGTFETNTTDAVRFTGAGTYAFGAGKSNIDAIAFGANVAGIAVSLTNSQSSTADYDANGAVGDFGFYADVAMTNGVSINASALTVGALLAYEADAENLAGADTILGSNSTTRGDDFYTGAGADSVNAGAGDDGISTEEGADTVLGGNGNDSLGGGDDNDSLDGGAGQDVLYGEAGSDTIVGGLNEDFIYGGTENDSIDGGAAADTLYGEDGADSIVGGAGADYIGAGLGADVVFYGSVADLAGDTVAGGAEAATDDAIRFDAAGAYNLASALVYDIDVFLLNQAAAGWSITLGGDQFTADEDNDGVLGDLRITSAAAQTQGVTIDGSAATVSLRIDGANFGGADTFISRGANEEAENISAGLGGDTVRILQGLRAGAALDGVSQQSTIDTLQIDAAYANDFTTATVTNFDRLQIGDYGFGSGASITLTNALVASADANQDGTGGDLTVSAATALSGGMTIDASAVTTGAITVSATNFNGSDSFVGGSGADSLAGGGGNDTLTGGGGADTLVGGADSDELTGGAGADSLSGGAGSDFFEISAADLVSGETISGGGGAADIDVVDLLGTGVFSFAGVTVTGVDNYHFDASAGAATLVITAAMAAQADTNGNGALGDVGVTATHDTTASFTVDASALTSGQALFTLYGPLMNGADTITGGAGSDTIDGDGGDDVIRGGLGADDLDYSSANTAGNDTFVYGAAAELTGDSIGGSQGLDTIRLDAAGAYDFTGNFVSGVDQIVLNQSAAGFTITLESGMIGSADFNQNGTVGDFRISSAVAQTAGVSIVGADFSGGGMTVVGANLGGSDSILGSGGQDSIEGGVGADTIAGARGADTLVGGAGNDVFLFRTADDGYNTTTGALTGDRITDFEAGTGSTSVDRLAFDADATFGSLLIGDGDAVVENVVRRSDPGYVNAGVAGTEILINDTTAVTNFQAQFNVLTNVSTGLIYVGFNSAVGRAQIFYDDNPSAAGGAVLLGSIDTVTSLAGMANIDASDFLFV